MALSAKERIYSLRETEFKLQKLHNQLLSSDGILSSSSDFLAHHKELMSLPGGSRNSIPFRFGFQFPKRYFNVTNNHLKLTLPPKLDFHSRNRIQPYKNADLFEELENPALRQTSAGPKQGVAKYPSLALQTLYNQLDEQTAKMAVAFPHLAKYGLNLAKLPFRKEALNSNRYLSKHSMQSKSNSISKSSFRSGRTRFLYQNPQTDQVTLDESTLSRSSTGDSKSKLSVRFNTSDDSNTPSSLTMAQDTLPKLTEPDLGASANQSALETDLESIRDMRYNSEELSQLRNSIAFALGSSNLMGVILSPNSKPVKRGPLGWNDRGSSIIPDASDNDSMTAKEAVTLLKRRRIQERKPAIQTHHTPPNRRGLIGVEISGFDPECAFFYRDRNGNYNPHLYQSKSIAENMKSSRVSKILRNP